MADVLPDAATEAHPRARSRPSLIPLAALGGGAALVASILAAVAVGAVPVPLSHVAGILANHLAPGTVEPAWSVGRKAIV